MNTSVALEGRRVVPGRRVSGFLVLFLLGAAVLLPGEDLNIYEHRSIAPISIPIGPAGADGIGMTRLRVRNFNNFDSVTSISQLTLQLVSDGTVSDSSITAVRVYFEGSEAAVGYGVYDNGAPNDDVLVSTGSPSFSGGVATVAIDPTLAKFGWPGGERHLYVVFDFDETANTATNLACAITEVTYGTENVGTEYNTTDDGPAIPALVALSGSTEKNLDNYEVTLAATGIAPAEATQTDTRVPVLRLVFDVADATVTADIESIRLRRVGTGSDGDLESIALYADTGSTAGSFDASDPAVPGASGTLSGGYVTLTPNNNLEITASSETYFVAVTVRSDAAVGASIGLDIQDPSADVVFVDTIDDDLVTVPAEYAYVTQGYPYLQEGYFDTGAPGYEAPTPTSGNTFTVEELVLPDTTAPTITVTIPTNGGTVASLDSPIEIYWSEDVTGAGDSPGADEANFVFEDQSGNPAAYTLSYAVSGTQYITRITPDTLLSYETIYQITVLSAGIEDKATPTPNGMAADYSFLFGTGQQYPTVTEPTALNNRIVSGGNTQVVILIPEPPAGDSDRMSVQVFTTTGKLVRTFYRDTAYSTIAASLPLLWDGTNGRGQPLGPGMYFIQIQATNFKRALKVLIVR